MEALPSKEIMKRRGLFNRISKIYRPTDTNIQFSTVQEAKDYFWTNEAQDLFRYCCEEQYRVKGYNGLLHLENQRIEA